MHSSYGVSPDDGLAMWVADMDFQSPDCVQHAVKKMLDHGIYGYSSGTFPYEEAVCCWLRNRHGWAIEPDWIDTTTGLSNAIALVLDTFSKPGDRVVLFSPVYHAFKKVVLAAGREITVCPLEKVDNQYKMNFSAYDEVMTGQEKIALLCSPHNPGGRVWTQAELRETGEFCRKHDLLLVSDEIHQDLVFPGHKHIPFPVAAPEFVDRLIVLSSASKTFNLAGTHTGQVIIPDQDLRKQFKKRISELSLGRNDFGVAMTTAAYSPEGAAWLDKLVCYLDGNRKLFDAGVNGIAGVSSMPMGATYLSWVDFSQTGLSQEEVATRIYQQAKIAANAGETFGKGGELHVRFNTGTSRELIRDAVTRLERAFVN